MKYEFDVSYSTRGVVIEGKATVMSAVSADQAHDLVRTCLQDYKTLRIVLVKATPP